jgi:hypothetical protein
MAANQLLIPIFCHGLTACALLNGSPALSQVLGPPGSGRYPDPKWLGMIQPSVDDVGCCRRTHGDEPREVRSLQWVSQSPGYI